MNATHAIPMSTIMAPPKREIQEFTFNVFVKGDAMHLEDEAIDFVKVPRGIIGVISVLLDKESAKHFEMLPLVFEGDHLNACQQRQLSTSGVLIWDNNDRGSGLDQETIKFSIILKKMGSNKVLYMDPIVINE